MGEGIAHIMSPWSAPWCGWIMLALLLCAVFAEFFQPGVVLQAPASLLARTDRTYKESPMNFYGQVFITLFRVGTMGMALCICLCSGRLSFAVYSAVCGIIVAVVLAKMVCNMLLDYTFSLARRVESLYDHYGNIVTLSVLVLYAALMVLMRFGNALAMLWVLISIAVLFLLIWLYRVWRLFVHSPISLVYVLLYMATLEVLPMVGLYFLSEKTISMI